MRKQAEINSEGLINADCSGTRDASEGASARHIVGVIFVGDSGPQGLRPSEENPTLERPPQAAQDAAALVAGAVGRLLSPGRRGAGALRLLLARLRSNPRPGST